MREIPLTKGYVALVDDEDYEWLSQRKWCAQEHHRTVYAGTSFWSETGKIVKQLHRMLAERMWGDGPYITDHRDGNGLNNCRYNLRRTDCSGNAQNRKRPINNTSGYKGVSWSRNNNKWVAVIMSRGKSIYLGLHKNVEDAARAYDRAAIIYHGENARTNFPQSGAE